MRRGPRTLIDETGRTRRGGGSIDMTPQELAEALAPLHEESFGWALSCCDFDEAVAEDVLQTSYLRVVSGKARFGGRSSLRTWLFGVIRRVALEERRRRRRRHAKRDALASSLPGAEAVENDTLDAVARSQESRRLQRALRSLADRQREVLHLVFYEGLSVAEAAEVMGVSVGSARTHYDRGKKRMRALLEPEAVRE